MRKLISIILTISILLFSVPVLADGESNNITVLLNGQELLFDVPPQMQNDRVMVPMRTIFEALGYLVEWNEVNRSISALNKQTDKYIFMTIDNPDIVICSYSESAQNNFSNDYFASHTQHTDQAPVMINDRALVPVRVISEASGLYVEWSETDQKVIISSEEIARDNTIKQQILGWWLYCENPNDGTARSHAYNIQFNEDGTMYLETWRTHGYGTYTIESPNKISVAYTPYINWAGSDEYVPEDKLWYMNFEFTDSLYEITDYGERYAYVHVDRLMTEEDIIQMYQNSCYDATNEINQIRSYIEQGLYLEAMQLCDEVKSQHILSEVDISVIDSLYETASYQYDNYLEYLRLEEIAIGGLNYAQAFFGEQFVLHGVATYDESEGLYWITVYWPEGSGHIRDGACALVYNPSAKQYSITESCAELLYKMFN